MYKFWLIQVTMPLWIALAIIAALVVGCVVWGIIQSIRDKFRKKPNSVAMPTSRAKQGEHDE